MFNPTKLTQSCLWLAQRQYKTFFYISFSLFEGNNNNALLVISGATTAELPPGVLYRVKATYGYVKEDVDELSFEIGDIIRVIEYDDPEDQVSGYSYINNKVFY